MPMADIMCLSFSFENHIIGADIDSKSAGAASFVGIKYPSNK